MLHSYSANTAGLVEDLPCPDHSLIISDKNWVGTRIGNLEGIISGSPGEQWVCPPPLQTLETKPVRVVTRELSEGV